jgi:4-amino-4-deoxy-L-arabinose transferase-like glycosyltransferase
MTGGDADSTTRHSPPLARHESDSTTTWDDKAGRGRSSAQGSRQDAERPKMRHFHRWLECITFAATVPQVAWILTHRPTVIPFNDAWYYHYQAQLIANGDGWFVAPFAYIVHHVAVPSAQHPPVWTLVLAVADVLGLTTFLSHLLVACVIGGAAVFVTGLAAREVAGPRAGLAAAVIAAAYPNYWLNDNTGLSEAVVLLLVSAVVWMSLRMWRQPTMARSAGLGALCALTALTRGEQILLVPFVLFPVVFAMRRGSLRRRLADLGVGVLATSLILAPWVAFNLSRFSEPVLLSSDLGSTLAFSNCRAAYQGPAIGYGSFQCLASDLKPVKGDESVADAHLRSVALAYMNVHAARLPVVIAFRLGREFGLYAPFGQVRLDSSLNRRPLVPSQIGLVMYYVLLPLAVVGGVTVRRRRTTIVPFVGICAEVVLTTSLTVGSIRYRVPLEVVLVVLAGVAVDSLLGRWRRPDSLSSSAA